MEFFGLSGDKALQETEEPQEHVITGFSKDSIRIIHRLPWRDGLDTEVCPTRHLSPTEHSRLTQPSTQHSTQPYTQHSTQGMMGNLCMVAVYDSNRRHAAADPSSHGCSRQQQLEGVIPPAPPPPRTSNPPTSTSTQLTSSWKVNDLMSWVHTWDDGDGNPLHRGLRAEQKLCIGQSAAPCYLALPQLSSLLMPLQHALEVYMLQHALDTRIPCVC